MKRPDRDRFADDFFRFLEVERNASPRTVVNYRHALAEFRKTPNLPAWKELTPDHFRRYLLEVSNVTVGILEPVTITSPGSHNDLFVVAECAWGRCGVPRDLLPICEDNIDY